MTIRRTMLSAVKIIRGVECSGFLRRGVFQHDFSALPDDAVIESATFEVYPYTADMANETIDVLRCTKTNIVESEVTWDEYKSASGWTAGGGDYATADKASVVFPDATNKWLSFDITEIVKTAQSNGEVVSLIMKFATENATGKNFRVYSKDYTGDSSLRHKLTIEYTQP